ncbi:DUF3617 family protein [Pusillimonas sp. CC-YST705]|uniref:DUF3617 family protein n=1 Tax=Mesopusillimonas faecipullorum TaxID=2755040 RepID=A0ABS8CA20_9BURK|nr:DUF3617 family protein [Mesopusillimonas faecipullorum]MCB5362891.1 DUF3617 family protein [Mesopusillimonas faecipullorum]
MLATNLRAEVPEPEPGLWHIKPEMRMNGRDVTQMMGALQAQLMAQLPAEQRERLPPIAKQAIQETKQVCVSAKDAKLLADPERALALWGKELADKGCKMGGHAVSGNTVTFEAQCPPGGKVFQGDVQGEFVYHSSRSIGAKVQGNGLPGAGGWADILQGAAQATSRALKSELIMDMQWQGKDCAGAPPVSGVKR